MLGALDRTLSPLQAASCEGDPAIGGALSEQELLAALRSLQRGIAAGSDGLPYEFYTAFWPAGLGELLAAALNEPFHSTAPQPQLSRSMRLGIVSLLYKGGHLQK